MFLNVLPLAGARALCYCLAEHCHEFAIAVGRHLISNIFLCIGGSMAYGVLVPCKPRVGTQVLLGAELVGWLGLVLEYLDVGDSG